jgi:glutathione peroxidase
MNSILLFSSKFLILFLAIYGFTMQNEALSNIYKFNFTSIEGQTINLKDFKGKPLLIVNSASLCGFTNQYNDLEEIYNKYRK